MTVRELHDDPAKMAAFMGWPFEDENALQERIFELRAELQRLEDMIYKQNTARRVPLSAIEATERRYADYCESLQEKVTEQKWDDYIRECAREVFGIRGRTAAEVQRKCMALRPDLYCVEGGEFAEPGVPTAAPASAAATPPPSRILR